MPSERELTAALGLSRTTVTRAYQQLRDQGYLRTRQGSGSVVHLPQVPGGRVDHLLAPGGTAEGEIDLTTTAPSSGPWLLEAYQRATEEVGAYLPGTGYYPSGLPVLREAVAQRYAERGLPTSADQILVTSGALTGTAIAVQALLSPGDRVVVESPTYPNAIATLTGARARIVVHPLEPGVSGEEWDAEGLALLTRQVGARAAYLVPDFHNPTGTLMDADQRERVGAALSRARVVPVIDESPVDLALDDVEMPPPLAASVPDAVTVGSVSKSYWSGLRIGWMRLPRARVEQMALSRLRMDLGAPVLEQLVVAALMERHEEVVRERRTRLRSGRDVLLDGVREHLPTWRVQSPPGGACLWCELPQPRSTDLAAAARRHGVVLAPGPTFAPSGGLDQWMRLPFALDEDRLAQAPPRLAPAWGEVLAGDDAYGSPERRRAPIIA
jgi:DNA-binding transcriptional MocR family regulator